MKSKRFFITLIAMLLMLLPVQVFSAESGTTLEGFEFVDRDYSELFYMLSLYSGISISADDTVQGRGTFRFAGQNFEEAFDKFLSAERLYVSKEADSWTVSRVRLYKPEENSSLWILDASDIKPSRLVEKLSVFFGTEISYDILPELSLSIHAEGSCAKDFVLSLVRRLGTDYEVQENSSFVKIVRNSQALNQRNAFASQRACSVLKNGEDSFSVNAENVSLAELVEKLFSLTGEQFVLVGELSESVRHIMLSEVSYANIMFLLSSEYGVTDVVLDGIHYVFSEQNKIDSALNNGKEWKTYSLSFINASPAIQLITSRFGKVELIPLPDQKNFLCRAELPLHKEIADFLQTVDSVQKNYTVLLQYITVDELLSHLPPQLKSSSFSKTTQDTLCFFTGTEDEYQLLLSAMKNIDCPVKRLRYDVLIVQYQNTEDFSWDNSFTANRLTMGDKNNVSAVLGSVLNFNLDVVSAFGLGFAASLQTALNKNNASVFADTTLYGVSGGTISFKNTNTYRYRDNNVDPATGKPIYTGITREIVSGLRLEVTGWISGDGMITSSITASVSRQGADLSSKTGNPPPTSEKIITTQVRAKSGEPIVLTGLVQDEESSAQEGVPLLSQIPGLGLLFKSKAKTKEHTEMVIYLVPHWEQDDADCKKDESCGEEFSVDSILREFVLEAEINE